MRLRSCLVLGAEKFASPLPLRTLPTQAYPLKLWVPGYLYHQSSKSNVHHLPVRCQLHKTYGARLLPLAHVLVSTVLLLSRSPLRLPITTAHASRATLVYSMPAWRSCAILQRPNIPRTPLCPCVLPAIPCPMMGGLKLTPCEGPAGATTLSLRPILLCLLH